MIETDAPFFSIIIPTYNSGRTLANALDSILAQTFEDFEVIVMDGGSQDDTLTIIDTYKSKLPSLLLKSEPDKGIYDAMNKGITIAHGKWLYFLGSDDRLYDRHVFHTVFHHLEANALDIVYGDVFSELHQDRYAGVFSYDDLTRQNICHQAIFFKKPIFDITGPFQLKYKAAADWDHNISWFLNPKIAHGYLDLIITYFAKGGYSDLNNDYPFESVKHYKFLKQGYFKLPFSTLKRLCKLEISKAKANRNLLTLSALEVYYLSLRLRRKFKLFKTVY